jgi:hypothetical protein
MPRQNPFVFDSIMGRVVCIMERVTHGSTLQSAEKHPEARVNKEHCGDNAAEFDNNALGHACPKNQIAMVNPFWI